MPGVSSPPLATTRDRPRRFPIAMPIGHFMAFGTPASWVRLLLDARLRVPPRYWPRVAWSLMACTIGLVVTAPERLILEPWLRWRFRGDAPTFDHPPGVVVVTGYYRSGTTHLHNVLACDSRFVTPRWRQCLAPQGFFASWTLLRAFLIPFLGNTRPQDDVPFGPDWPAEDDFGVCNWTMASALPGRFSVYERRAHWARFHNLQGLTARELRRWRWAQAALLWKISRARPSAPLLLKSPSHTGRVAELARLLGKDRVRFVHIARDPAAVLRSNLAMHRRFDSFSLQHPPPEGQTREYLIAEYSATEARYAEQSRSAGVTASDVRYQDLVADPVGELRRVYGELGLAWTHKVETSVARYLHAVGEYRPRHSAKDGDEDPLDPRLAGLRGIFDLDRETIQRRVPPRVEKPERSRKRAWGVLALVAALIAVAWVTLAWLAGNRLDALVWPTGLAIGLATIRSARVGSTALGLAAGGLTLLVYAAVLYPATYLAYAHAWGRPALDSWIAVRNSVLLTPGNHFFLTGVGVVTAYRCASRRHLRPPGA